MKNDNCKERRKNGKTKVISLILKAIVVFCAVSGVTRCLFSDSGSFMGGLRMLLYFTIQSNIAIAVICCIGGVLLLSGRKIPDRWYIIKFVGTIAITLTGAVFCFVLAPTMGGNVWNMVNLFTHVIVPIVSVADFFVSGIDADIPRSKVGYVLLPPLVYVCFAGVGYVRGWNFSHGANYPYFFLDWGNQAGAFGFSSEFPFMGCMWWIMILSVLIILVGLLYLQILKIIKKHYNK